MNKTTENTASERVLGREQRVGQLPDSVRAFAESMRQIFGPGVRLLQSVDHVTGECVGRAIWDDAQAEWDARRKPSAKGA